MEPPRRGSLLEVFAAWHKEPSLYREIYARTVAALAAAFVIYLIAVVAGIANRQPLFPIGIGFTVFGTWILALDVRHIRRLKAWQDGGKVGKFPGFRAPNRGSLLLIISGIAMMLSPWLPV